MYEGGLLHSAGPIDTSTPLYLQRAIDAATEAADEAMAFFHSLSAAEEKEVFIDESFEEYFEDSREAFKMSASVESLKELGGAEEIVASLESTIKDWLIRTRDAIMELIRKAKEHVLKIWRMYTDRVQKIYRRAQALRKKVEGKTFSMEESEEIAKMLVEKHPSHVWYFSVDKGNQLVIHPNQVAFFKKYVDKYVDVQEADTKMAKAVVQRLKNQVKNIKQGQTLDTSISPEGYANIILSKIGKDPVAPGGVGFDKPGVIDSHAQVLSRFSNFKVESLTKDLAKFASRDSNFVNLMDFILAVTQDKRTFATDTEEMRRGYFDELQSTTEKSVEHVMKSKGYEGEENEQVVRSIQQTVRDALEIGYRATTALHRAWLQSFSSMLLITTAFASKRHGTDSR